MATQPAAQGLPLFYKDLVPLNSNEHANFKSRQIDNATFMQGQHAIPLTVEEFVSASRYYPIIFSAGDNPVPLALMGMNEGINVFMDDQGKFNNPVYLPAYIRRYPFMLARLRPDSDELSRSGWRSIITASSRTRSLSFSIFSICAYSASAVSCPSKVKTARVEVGFFSAIVFSP